MKTLICRYPGDPPIECLEMTRAEFLARHPREPIQIHGDGEVNLIPMQANEIWCDGCGNDPGDYVLMIGRTKAMCQRCAAETYLPHCREVLTTKGSDVGVITEDFLS